MTKLSKRVRREETEYKSDRIPTDEDEKMGPVPDFKSELVINIGEAQPGDVLLVAKRVENPEEAIPEGSFGCYISMGGTGIRAELNEVKSDIVSLKNANKRIEEENKRLKESVRVFILIEQRRCAEEAENDILQLIGALESVIIKTVYPEAGKSFGKRNLKFNYVLSKLKKTERDKLINKDIYKKIMTIKSIGFDEIARFRNQRIHPSRINIDELIQKRNMITDECFLTEESRILFELSSTMLNQLLQLDELKNLISVYNGTEESPEESSQEEEV